MEQENKVLKVDEDLLLENKEQGGDDDDNMEDNENENNQDGEEILNLVQLPPEMLLKILGYVDEQTLLKTRLVCVDWNAICCDLIHKKKSRHNSKSNYNVYFKTKRVLYPAHKENKKDRWYADFLEAFNQDSGPRPCPFSSFHLENLNDITLEQFVEYLVTFRGQIKCVYITVRSNNTIIQFERIWRLLTHFAPSIEYMKIVTHWSIERLKFVDPVTTLIDNFDPNFTRPNEKLLHLKELEICASHCQFFHILLTQLLVIAPNLETVRSFDSLHRSNSLHNLWCTKICANLSKINLIKKLDVQFFDGQFDFIPADFMKNLKIQKLSIGCYFSSECIDSDKSADKYIHYAVKSSAESLKTLKLNHPNSKHISLCFKNMESLPNIMKLDLHLGDEGDMVLCQLGKLCINVKILKIRRIKFEHLQSHLDPWKEFTKLKTLKFQLCMRNGEITAVQLDSVITGFGHNSIRDIQHCMLNGNSLEEAKRGKVKSPAIIDLQELQVFQINLMMRKRTKAIEIFENQIQNCIFIQMLPQYIRENPISVCFTYDKK